MTSTQMTLVIIASVMTRGPAAIQVSGGTPAPAAQAAQTATAPRPTPPTRDPNTAGYVTGKELPDSAVPPADANGNFIVGPTHNPAPEMTAKEDVPQGTIYNLTMSSADSKIYPGIARDPGTFGTVDPVTLPSWWSRRAIRLPTLAVWRFTCPSNTCPVPRHPSSSAPMGPTSCCSQRSIR